MGMVLHGEQGYKEVHPVITTLKEKSRGIQKDENRLRNLMQEHLTHASYLILSSPMLLATASKKENELGRTSRYVEFRVDTCI